MNKESKEYKRVRDIFAMNLQHTPSVPGWHVLPEDVKEPWRELADRYLSIEGIEIRADDQNLPVTRTQVEFIEKLRADFKRVI